MSRQIWTIFFVQERFYFLGCKNQNFKKDDDRDICMVQNLTKGEAGFNRFMLLRNQLVLAAENFAKEKLLSPVLIPTPSKDMDEQLNVAHKVVDAVDGANRKSDVNLLRYSLYDPESSSAHIRIFPRKRVG